jgi:radical SAM protein with 4Fe4S-binding SPASM domain
MTAGAAHGAFPRIVKVRELLPQLHRLLLRGELHFTFEKVPYTAISISWRKRRNFFVAALNQLFLPARPLGYPVIAQVEPANVCNLRCPLCFTVSQSHSRPPALLAFETFRRLVDDVGDYLLFMVLWSWGEPFLNPDLLRIIEYAAARGIIVHTSTNGNVEFDDLMAERIVHSGLSSIVFAVDGATQQTYQAYRVGGDLEKVRRNLRALAEAKRRLRAARPQLILRFVAMRQNEDELPAVERMAAELGADFFSIKSVDLPPEFGPELDRKYLPADDRYRRYQYVEGTYDRKAQPFACVRPWKRITMDASGELISCEYDFRNRHGFGRVGGTDSAQAVWKSGTARAFRRDFRKGHNDCYHCRACTYRDLPTEDCILEVRSVPKPTMSGR